MKKQIVSTLLALCMLLCLMPTAAFAEDSTETISIGFTRTPFCITSKCRWKPVLSPVLPT